jgi:hypothetical protein
VLRRRVPLAATAVALVAVLAACARTSPASSSSGPTTTASRAAVATADRPSGTRTASPQASAVTQPPRLRPATLHVTAAGDYGSTSATSGVLRAVAAAQPDLHLALGDLSYGSDGGEAAWCRFVTDRVGPRLPFELLSGNHESNGLNGRIDAFTGCLPNRLDGLVGRYGREWYVDEPAVQPLVRFVMVSPALTFADGTWSYARGTTHYAWTASAIRGARAAGIPWVVVGMHEPCLSLGRYGCTVGADLVDLFLAEHVDVVLTGHEHLYQRSKQLRLGPGCPGITPGRYVPACVSSAGSSLVAGAGTVFVTVGTGGIPLRDVSTSDAEAGYFAASSGANRAPTHGFADLAATPSTLRVGFIGTSGAGFADRVVLTRPAAP